MLIKDSRGGRIIFRDRLGVDRVLSMTVPLTALGRNCSSIDPNSSQLETQNIHVVPGNWGSEELALGIYC